MKGGMDELLYFDNLYKIHEAEDIYHTTSFEILFKHIEYIINLVGVSM
jgi:hypothetical protein